jgi:hypothetical protein
VRLDHITSSGFCLWLITSDLEIHIVSRMRQASKQNSLDSLFA